MPATFDGTNRIITLPEATSEINVEQDLYSDWKEFVKVGNNAQFAPAFRTISGDPLTAALEAAPYFFLRNDLGWRIRPAEEDATVFFTGNLIAEDSTLPLTIPTIGAFTVLLLGLQPITQNVDALRDFQRNLQFQLESLLNSGNSHAVFGDVYYWDPVNGDDGKNGSSPSKAVLTFAQAQTLVTDNNDDIIFIINSTSGPITITETLSVTKNDFHIRGAGADILFSPSTATDVITVTGRNISFSDFEIEQTTAGGHDCFNLDGTTGGHILIRDIKIREATGNGITVNKGEDNSFVRMLICDCAGDAINMSDVENARIDQVQAKLSGGWAFQVLSTSPSVRSRFVRFSDNVTHGNVSGSVNIGTDSDATIIDDTNFFASGGSNDLVTDSGTNTHNNLIQGSKGLSEETWRLHGLQAGVPLVVDDANNLRTTGTIEQEVLTDVGLEKTTVTRLTNEPLLTGAGETILTGSGEILTDS